MFQSGDVVKWTHCKYPDIHARFRLLCNVYADVWQAKCIDAGNWRITPPTNMCEVYEENIELVYRAKTEKVKKRNRALLLLETGAQFARTRNNKWVCVRYVNGDPRPAECVAKAVELTFEELKTVRKIVDC